MKKTIIKIYFCFIIISVITSIILLILNFLTFALTFSDERKVYNATPQKMLEETVNAYENGRKPDIPDGTWTILISTYGNVIWSENMPEDIPSSYSINDVAKMAKWFLNDYPVYLRTEEYGLFVLGYPKNAVGKYDMEYSMAWFDSLPQRIVIVFAVNVIIAAILACMLSTGIYKNIKTVMLGISSLRNETPLNLKEKGFLRVVVKNMNKTSQKIQYKNDVIKRRDNARANWIAGVSHDIRTPLSVISGCAEELMTNEKLTADEYGKLELITAQTMKIKKLVGDLNLISSLEYDMQPLKMTDIKVCFLLRHVASDIINSSVNADIELILNDENAVVRGDEHLIERAVFNIINNSVVHNESCKVTITERIIKSDNLVEIEIRDNGTGVEKEVIDNIGIIPKTAHGLGLPVAYRIITAHGGNFIAENDNGFCVTIILSCK